MKVYYSKPKKTNLSIAKSDFYKLVNEIIKCIKLNLSKELAASVNFVDSKTICRINLDYVGHKGITDVISFNYLTDADLLSSSDIFAELFICIEKAETESHDRLIDFSEELTLYIVHGLLHIAGFDDLKASERKQMRNAEASCMKLLKNKFKLNEIFTLKNS